MKLFEIDIGLSSATIHSSGSTVIMIYKLREARAYQRRFSKFLIALSDSTAKFYPIQIPKFQACKHFAFGQVKESSYSKAN